MMKPRIIAQNFSSGSVRVSPKFSECSIFLEKRRGGDCTILYAQEAFPQHLTLLVRKGSTIQVNTVTVHAFKAWLSAHEHKNPRYCSVIKQALKHSPFWKHASNQSFGDELPLPSGILADIDVTDARLPFVFMTDYIGALAWASNNDLPMDKPPIDDVIDLTDDSDNLSASLAKWPDSPIDLTEKDLHPTVPTSVGVTELELLPLPESLSPFEGDFVLTDEFEKPVFRDVRESTELPPVESVALEAPIDRSAAIEIVKTLFNLPITDDQIPAVSAQINQAGPVVNRSNEAALTWTIVREHFENMPQTLALIAEKKQKEFLHISGIQASRPAPVYKEIPDFVGIYRDGSQLGTCLFSCDVTTINRRQFWTGITPRTGIIEPSELLYRLKRTDRPTVICFESGTSLEDLTAYLGPSEPMLPVVLESDGSSIVAAATGPAETATFWISSQQQQTTKEVRRIATIRPKSSDMDDFKNELGIYIDQGTDLAKSFDLTSVAGLNGARHKKDIQEAGIRKILANTMHGLGTILTHPTGYGKTYIALLATFEAQRLRLISGPVVIICGKTMRKAWTKAISEITSSYPPEPLKISSKLADFQTAQYIVTTPELISRQNWTPEFLSGIGGIIIDECHTLTATETSATYKKIREVMAPNARTERPLIRMLLSATPISNAMDQFLNQVACTLNAHLNSVFSAPFGGIRSLFTDDNLRIAATVLTQPNPSRPQERDQICQRYSDAISAIRRLATLTTCGITETDPAIAGRGRRVESAVTLPPISNETGQTILNGLIERIAEDPITVYPESLSPFLIPESMFGSVQTEISGLVEHMRNRIDELGIETLESAPMMQSIGQLVTQKLLEPNHKIVIFVNRIYHGEILTAYLKKKFGSLSVEFLSGQTTENERNQHLARFNEKISMKHFQTLTGINRVGELFQYLANKGLLTQRSDEADTYMIAPQTFVGCTAEWVERNIPQSLHRVFGEFLYHLNLCRSFRILVVSEIGREGIRIDANTGIVAGFNWNSANETQLMGRLGRDNPYRQVDQVSIVHFCTNTLLDLAQLRYFSKKELLQEAAFGTSSPADWLGHLMRVHTVKFAKFEPILGHLGPWYRGEETALGQLVRLTTENRLEADPDILRMQPAVKPRKRKSPTGEGQRAGFRRIE